MPNVKWPAPLPRRAPRLHWSIAWIFWMLWLTWLAYAYMAVAIFWLFQAVGEWWQARQDARAAIAARADAENQAWLAGRPGAEYGQYQPHPLTRQDLHDQDRRAS
ncbi:hypothetical protein ACK8HH_17365 [Gordonia sp. LUNF6]|uniref:hypothetical protein n=1 Tax=Gordonia sp. LUNF6 TaxID=3388658 RepID=UPI003999CC02